METLNDRGLGQIWMVTVRTIKIGESPAAPLFTVVAEPSEDATADEMTDPYTNVRYCASSSGAAMAALHAAAAEFLSVSASAGSRYRSATSASAASP